MGADDFTDRNALTHPSVAETQAAGLESVGAYQQSRVVRAAEHIRGVIFRHYTDLEATSHDRLPREFLEAGAKRLGVAAFLTAIGYAVLATLQWMLAPETADATPVVASSAVAIGASIVVCLLAAKNRDRPGFLADVSQYYVALLGLTLGIVEAWPGWDDTWFVGASWVCVVIIAFPMTVPNTPRKVLIGSSMAAILSALGLYLCVEMGTPMPTPRAALSHLLPTFICVGVAYILVRILFAIGQDVVQARELGAYRLEELIGSGGMGEVWLASHRMLARPAAVKLIREGVEGGGQTSDAARQRFAREAQTTANLGSPHTVQLYDYGVADDGTFYYVMEHLNGIDLETLVKDFGPISPARTIHLLKQMCHSLDEAHKNGLIHRDIKPANVIICRLGLEVDFVKVVDFGLVATKENTDSQITQAGAVPGTPAYMAPEMAQAVQVDNRSDLYAVGCVAYWLLTGTQVFTAPTAMAVILKHVSDEPEPLSKRAKRIIPADLEAVVMACLAKKPAERPQSARDLSERLATCELSETWTDDEAQQWWREHMGKEMTLST